MPNVKQPYIQQGPAGHVVQRSNTHMTDRLNVIGAVRYLLRVTSRAGPDPALTHPTSPGARAGPGPHPWGRGTLRFRLSYISLSFWSWTPPVMCFTLCPIFEDVTRKSNSHGRDIGDSEIRVRSTDSVSPLSSHTSKALRVHARVVLL
jgi:hypothetical protein